MIKAKKIILPVLLGFVLIVSGCTIPGLGGGKVQSEYENDIVIIKDQSVNPQNVKAGQTISLVTYVQNLAEKNPPNFAVTVNLYDTCGVFKEIKPKCPSASPQPGVGETECKNMKLLPKEVKEIS